MPIAATRERVCLALQRMFAQATILIVTRGFRTELASGYSEYIRAGGRLRIGELMAPEAGPYAAAFFDYDAVLSLYEQAFGEEAVIALPYEMLRDNPSAFVGVLETRLGLEPQGIRMSSLNPSLSPASLYWYRVLSSGMEGLASRLGSRLGPRLYESYVREMNRDRFKRPVRLMQRLLPNREVTEDDVPGEVVEACRGRAARLGESKLYAPYAIEYLNEQ